MEDIVSNIERAVGGRKNVRSSAERNTDRKKWTQADKSRNERRRERPNYFLREQD